MNSLAGGLTLTLNFNFTPGGIAGNVTTLSPPMIQQLLENIRVAMRSAGYSEQMITEVTSSVGTLSTYGILALTQQPVIGPHPYNLDVSPTTPHTGGLINPQNGIFSPMGSVGFGSMATNSLSLNPTRFDRYSAVQGDVSTFESYRRSPVSLQSPNGPLNTNSFGLGTCQNVALMRTSPTHTDGINKIELEVGENIVGAILGPGGKSLVEIQHFSGANIQISKKGTFAPGTRNRLVTITGMLNAVSTARYLIEQRISEEENKRARQNALIN